MTFEPVHGYLYFLPFDCYWLLGCDAVVVTWWAPPHLLPLLAALRLVVPHDRQRATLPHPPVPHTAPFHLPHRMLAGAGAW